MGCSWNALTYLIINCPNCINCSIVLSHLLQRKVHVETCIDPIYAIKFYRQEKSDSSEEADKAYFLPLKKMMYIYICTHTHTETSQSLQQIINDAWNEKFLLGALRNVQTVPPWNLHLPCHSLTERHWLESRQKQHQQLHISAAEYLYIFHLFSC